MGLAVKLDKKSEELRVLVTKKQLEASAFLQGMSKHGHGGVVASTQVLQEKAAFLFGRVCVNPKVLSPEAVEFMLAVAASHGTLSPGDSDAASQADVILRGVHPSSFQHVLLVCTTTMFAMPIAPSDVHKAQSRASLWRSAVGPAFVVVPVVAGFAISPEAAALSIDMDVVSCDLNE